MATVAAGAGPAGERQLFVRKATDLVHGWSVRDAFSYATFEINTVAMGIRSYARIQKVCFYGGVFGLAVVAILFLVNSKTGFISHFNRESKDLFGVDNAYATTLKKGTDGYTPASLGGFTVGATLLLI